MPAAPQFSPDDASREALAAAWLARRDRGLTAAEQDEYLHWLAADAEHRRITARLEKTWGALDALREWQPKHSAQPNPDLLAPRARRKILSFPVVLTGLAAAAIVAFAVFALRPAHPEEPARTEVAATRAAKVISEPQRLTLADGSIVTLNRGGKVEAHFTAAERRVRLMQGEAHFAVTHNAARPFIVEAGTVAVRAVGTAFDVKLTAPAVEVLVTEGKVDIEHPAVPHRPLAKGERAVVDARDGEAVVSTPSVAEVDRLMQWQGVMLDFADLPLSEVVAEFNLRNRQQVIVADDDTGRVPIGGKFRADNVEAFVRLMERTGLASERRPDGTIVLRLVK